MTTNNFLISVSFKRAFKISFFAGIGFSFGAIIGAGVAIAAFNFTKFLMSFF